MNRWLTKDKTRSLRLDKVLINADCGFIESIKKWGIKHQETVFGKRG